MKRCCVLILLAVLMFTLTACGTSDESAFTYKINSDHTITITGYRAMKDSYYSKHHKIVIPSSIDGKKVTVIGENIFEGFASSSGIEIVIPNGVVSIEKRAFAQSGLTSMNIPGSVMYIGEGAFAGCENMLKITISNSVKSIGDGAFNKCSNLAEITIPESVETIGDAAFNFCANLNKVVIPASVTDIGDNLFLGTYNGPNDTDFILCVVQGTHAESWAKDNDIPCVYTK